MKRVASIDALRGFVMFVMIFVNDLASVGKVVPDWMMHYELRHSDANGLTFVDLVFPAFLFIVGLAIPFALESRLSKGEPIARVLRHVLTRTLSLLFIGVLMVNESPSAEKLGWSPALWQVLMFGSAILAFSSFMPRGASAEKVRRWKTVSLVMRCLGLASLLWLGLAWIGPDGERILTLSPFSLRSQWWGILGLIGWDYLIGCVVYLTCRGRLLPTLLVMVMLLTLFVLDRRDVFDGFWLSDIVGIGDTLGTQGAVTVAGVMLAGELRRRDDARGFAIGLMLTSIVAALLLGRIYGYNKNACTPGYGPLACGVTTGLWLLMDLLARHQFTQRLVTVAAIAGTNVLLAYLLSEAWPFVLEAAGLDSEYDHLAQTGLVAAVLRSLACAAFLLGVSARLNKAGFALRL